jgi:Ca-activated chloride channel family protein
MGRLACIAGLLVIALATPGWRGAGGAPRVAGRDLVLAIDVSRSMKGEDAFPNRLEAAISIARELVLLAGESPGDRAGLVAFAGRGVPRCPLTENLGAALAMIDGLEAGSVQPPGSDVGWALTACLDMFDTESAVGQVVFLISDGEDHAGRWREPAALLAEEGIVVHAIGLGDDRAGAAIVRSGDRGASGNAVVAGQEVISRRVDSTLEFIAGATGGSYIPAGVNRLDARAVFRPLLGKAPPVRAHSQTRRGMPDRSFWFLLPATLLLAFAGRLRARRGAFAVTGLVGLSLTGMTGMAGDGQDPGWAAFRASRYEEALTFYLERAIRGPSAPLARYNAGEVYFQIGRYEEAEAAYRAAVTDAPESLLKKIDYARANALAALARYDEALEAYDACLSRPVGDAASAAVHDDARVNREFVANLSQSIAAREPSGPSSDSSSAGNRPPRDAETPRITPSSGGNGPEGQQVPPGEAEAGGDRANSDEAGGSPGGGTSEGPSSVRPPASPLERLASAIERIENTKNHNESAFVEVSSLLELPDW